MSKEKLLVLNMLKEGKITEEEALRLLEAMGEDLGKDKEDKGFKDIEENVVNKLSGVFEKVVKKTQNLVSGINFEDINFDNINFGSINFDAKASFGKYKGKIEKVINQEVDKDLKLNLDFMVKNGKLTVLPWDNDNIEIKSLVYFDENIFDKEYEFFKQSLEGDTFIIAPSYPNNREAFDLSLQISLPRKAYGKVKMLTKSGNIDLTLLEADQMDLNTDTGKIIVNHSKAKDITLNGVSGKIEVNSLEGENLQVKHLNGKINIQGLYVENSEINVTNGVINIVDLGENVKVLDVKTTNGKIKLLVANYLRGIKVMVDRLNKYTTRLNLSERFSSIVQGNKELVAYDDLYKDENPDSLIIKASTVNGTINIE